MIKNKELMAELPEQGSLGSGKCGLSQPIMSVPAGQATDNPESKTSLDPFVAENVCQHHDADGTNTAVHLTPRMSAVSWPMDKDTRNSTERGYLLLGSKRSADSLCKASLKDFVILQSANALNTLQRSADFNKWPLEYDTSEMGGCCRCHVILGGHVLSDAVGENKSAAKTAAAEQAVKYLSSICSISELLSVSTQKLGDTELDDTLKHSEVCQHCMVFLLSRYLVVKTHPNVIQYWRYCPMLFLCLNLVSFN